MVFDPNSVFNNTLSINETSLDEMFKHPIKPDLDIVIFKKSKIKDWLKAIIAICGFVMIAFTISFIICFIKYKKRQKEIALELKNEENHKKKYAPDHEHDIVIDRNNRENLYMIRYK
jgi:large-conductance mechanosensitive channel